MLGFPERPRRREPGNYIGLSAVRTSFLAQRIYHLCRLGRLAMREDALPGCIDCVSPKPPKAQVGQNAVPAHTASTCSSPFVSSPLTDISSASSGSLGSSGDPRRSQSSKRQGMKLRRQQKLSSFLSDHRFEDVSEPRLSTRCCFFQEAVYPIHVAAQLGDADIVHMLLAAAADPNQRTSRGLLAVDLASARNQDGSHCEVMELLQGQLKVVGLRDAIALMRSQTQMGNALEGSSPKSSGMMSCCHGMRWYT